MLREISYRILVDLDIHSRVLLVRRVDLRSMTLRDWHTLEFRYLIIPLSLMLIHLMILMISRYLRCSDSEIAYIVGFPRRVQLISSSSKCITFSLFRKARN